jgi:anti-sigma factor RsiW
MHLGMNEPDEISNPEALEKHLKTCKKCRTKLAKIKEVDVFTFLAQPRSAKYKEAMKKLIEQPGKEGANNEIPKDPDCK